MEEGINVSHLSHTNKISQGLTDQRDGIRCERSRQNQGPPLLIRSWEGINSLIIHKNANCLPQELTRFIPHYK